jgi:hypothetical protein
MTWCWYATSLSASIAIFIIICPWKSAPTNIMTKFNVYGSVHCKNILIYIQKDATLHSLFYLETAVHVSGRTTTHHQERTQLCLQRLIFVRPLLLSAAIAAGSTKQNIQNWKQINRTENRIYRTKNRIYRTKNRIYGTENNIQNWKQNIQN